MGRFVCFVLVFVDCSLAVCLPTCLGLSVEVFCEFCPPFIVSSPFFRQVHIKPSVMQGNALYKFLPSTTLSPKPVFFLFSEFFHSFCILFQSFHSSQREMYNPDIFVWDTQKQTVYNHKILFNYHGVRVTTTYRHIKEAELSPTPAKTNSPELIDSGVRIPIDTWALITLDLHYLLALSSTTNLGDVRCGCCVAARTGRSVVWLHVGILRRISS